MSQKLKDLVGIAVSETQADGVEATLVSQSLQELRLANNAVIQSMELESATLSIRAIFNGVAAVATTNDMSEKGILLAAKRAGELASVAGKVAGDYPTLSTQDAPAPASLTSPVCERTLRRTTEDHIHSLLPAIDRSKADGTSLAGHSRSGLRMSTFNPARAGRENIPQPYSTRCSLRLRTRERADMRQKRARLFRG